MTVLDHIRMSALAPPGALAVAFSVLVACTSGLPTATIPSGTPQSLATNRLRPEPTATPRALPACVQGDEQTRYAKLDQWKMTLLDTNLRLARTYEPGDLVPVSRAGIEGGGLIRKIAIRDLKALTTAAKSAGNPIDVRSAFRSYQYQVATFDSWVIQVGREEALRVSARPGHSEHQLGTTLDFGGAANARDPWAFDDWGETPPGKWLLENAWRYGFLLSYPKEGLRESCYSYEPWHYRYVGRDLAREVIDSGQVPRRYLWENFETNPS